MTLTISENWIRERVQLKHENADDVRSLALPGTYHEKITNLGNSLLSFTRLKHLDLSRNTLQSLDGLKPLPVLETLNLYYNNIATLKELYKLRHNTLLEEVDLRLNPVTKNEPDYRLFVVHMLPNLRKLDDRSVRDSERKAALMHFNTDQATELAEHPAHVKQAPTEKQPVPRADYVKNMSRKTSALDDDDCEVLDLIARTGDLSLPQPLTGSKAVYPKAMAHTLTDIRQFEQAENTAGMKNSDAHSLSPTRHTNTYSGERSSPTRTGYRTQYVPHGYDVNNIGNDSEESNQFDVMPNGVYTTPHSKYIPLAIIDDSLPTPPTPEFPEIDPGILTPIDSPDASLLDAVPSAVYNRHMSLGGTQPMTQPTTHCADRQVRVQFADDVESRPVEGHDSNLKFADESKAYTAYTSRGHFTPHPGLSGSQKQDLPPHISRSKPVVPPKQNVPSVSRNQSTSNTDAFSQPPPVQRAVNQISDHGEPVQEQSSGWGINQQQFLDKFLTVVDRYWNGSKSLQRHAKFQSQAQALVCNLLAEVTSSSGQEKERLQQDIAQFAQENVSLRGQFASQRSAANSSAKSQVDETRLQLALEETQQDVGALKHQLHLSMQENQRLQEQLNSTPVATLPPPPQPTANSLTQQVDQQMLNTLEAEVELLQRDNATLKLQLKHFTQLQELVTMLQESHRSLVTTNDHLLKELDEGKLCHSEEVKQLHWSYGELKRTMELTGNSNLTRSLSSRMNGRENSMKLNGVS